MLIDPENTDTNDYTPTPYSLIGGAYDIPEDWGPVPPAPAPENIAAFQPAPNVWQVSMFYEQQGQVMVNVFNMYRSTGWAGESFAAVADRFRNWQSTHLRTVQTTGTILRNIKVRDLSVYAGASQDFPVTTASGGTINGNNEPGNVTLAITWVTTAGGHSGRGRTFHIGLPEQWVDNSIVPSNEAALILEKYNLLPGMVNVNGARLVVLSRFSQRVRRASATVAGITGAILRDRVIDSQRRRLPGRGR